MNHDTFPQQISLTHNYYESQKHEYSAQP